MTSPIDENLPPGVHTRVLTVDMDGPAEPIQIPYLICQGAARGQALCFLAGEHGVELAGVGGILTFARGFQPEHYRGRLIMVPAVNPPNVVARTNVKAQPGSQPHSYQMAYNTFKKWPGRADGDPAQRICHAIATSILPGSACVVNFHTWTCIAAPCAFPGGNPHVPAEAEIAPRLGVQFVSRAPYMTEYDPAAATVAQFVSFELETPAFLVELSTQWIVPLPAVALCQCVIRSICRHFGLTEPAAEPEGEAPFVYWPRSEVEVRAVEPGLYVPLSPLGTAVETGDVLGFLFDPATGRMRDVVAPCPGRLNLNSRLGAGEHDSSYMHAYAEAGDLLAMIRGG